MESFTPATAYRKGDRVSVNVQIKRRWWQFWLPRHRIEQRTMVVVEAS